MMAQMATPLPAQITRAIVSLFVAPALVVTVTRSPACAAPLILIPQLPERSFV